MALWRSEREFPNTGPNRQAALGATGRIAEHRARSSLSFTLRVSSNTASNQGVNIHA